MVKYIQYQSMSMVLESWELARQRFGSEEQVGTKILINLFKLEPETKTVFGFRPDQDIESNPLLMMGVLVHGARIVQMLDSVLSLLGPDTEMLEELLSEVGERHKKVGVKPEYFKFMGAAIESTLREIIGEKKFNVDISKAWIEVFHELSGEIVNAMREKSTLSKQRHNSGVVMPRAA